MQLQELSVVTGKTANITGGGNGIGKSNGLMLARAGASIAVSDLKFGDTQKVVEEILANGGRVLSLD